MLKHTEHRVVVKANDELKNSWQLAGGPKIRLERQYNNLNRRETQPVNAIVVSSEYIPEGTEILIHHNCVDPNYEIYNYQQLSGEETASDWRYYSIPMDMCYLYKDGDDWLPLKGFECGLRVYTPYNGVITGIEPKVIRNVLFMTTGEYKNKVCHTINAVDYQIIFQGINGREDTRIRCLPNGDERLKKEPEIIAIDHYLTKKVLDGELLVGYTISDAKLYKEYHHV